MTPNDGILHGETALVTGAGRGIGLAIATAFADAGAAIALVARSETELDAARRAVERSGGPVAAHRADVTDAAAMAGVVDQVRESLGSISILVNNAGTITPIGPFGGEPFDDWWRGVEVNLRGPTLCTHLVLEDMMARGRGRIINLVSGGGTVSFTYFSAYVASKTAVVRWTESVAAELAPYGVRVFAMEPGTVATAMSNYSVTSPQGRRWIPWFKKMFDLGLDSSMERVVDRAIDLAAGRADPLSGRYIPLTEPLEDLVANASRIQQDTLYSLRIGRLPSAPPSVALRELRALGEKASASVVRLGRRLPLTPGEAIDLWRDGNAVASWFLPPSDAQWIESPVVEPHPGGRFNLHLSAGGNWFRINATFVAVAPDTGIELQWSWQSSSPILGSGHDTKVNVSFGPARGGVDVTVTHDGLPNETVRDAYIRGWRRCLDGMLRVASGNHDTDRLGEGETQGVGLR
jgi:NAD(P)-dependent dehydrogenase (short-subunit alcohol dehydrogenase family)/uncharacterized protein YndB with AHSA1/START domain